MSSIRIQPSLPTTAGVVGGADGTASKTTKARGINLFDLSALQQAPQAQAASSGGAVSLPSLSNEDVGKMQSLFGDIDADKQGDINGAGEALGTALFKMLQGNGNQPAQIGISDDDDGAIKPMKLNTNLLSATGSSKLATSSKMGTTASSSSSTPYTGVNEAAPSVLAATKQASQAYSAGNPNAGYDNQVQAVTYMGVTNLQSQMTAYAQQVAAKQKQQAALSADASELSTAVSEWPAGTDTQSFTVHQADANGNLQEVTKTMTKDQAKTAADTAQAAASSMQDQSQTDMLQLQNMAQNYNNAISTISNLMKVSYDTVKNTIGNVHY